MLTLLLVLLGAVAVAGPELFDRRGQAVEVDSDATTDATTDATPGATPDATPSAPESPTVDVPTDAAPDAPSPETYIDESALAQMHESAAPEPEEDPPLTFRMTSFNVLGSSHTGPGGEKPEYADGNTRIGWAADLLRGQGIDVAGLQEFEPGQHVAFMNRNGDSWDSYPGLQLGNRGVRNSIIWDPAKWRAIERHTVLIPYFHGKLVPMPYVLLEHQETGRQAWFINIHNPASSRKRGNHQHWRNVATQKQVDLMADLGSGDTPVFLMGDFNERDEAFCKVTASGRATAANGGTGGPPCSVPGRAGIDWIFATPEVTFSGYTRFESDLVRRTSDHPMIIANATLD